MNKIYLDHAATTPVDKKVLRTMLPFFRETFGNASSLHSWGDEAKNSVEKTRRQAAKALNCLPEEITFTSGATESNNLALKGIFEGLLKKFPTFPKLHFITTAIEHPCVLDTFYYLKERYPQKFRGDILKVDKQGLINMAELKTKIKANTVLVSIMFANNEIGSLQPIRKIGGLIEKIKRKRTVRDLPLFFHTDAVQAFPYYKVDMRAQNLDLVTLSGHKIYGPKGIGLLAAKKNVPLAPIIHGGGHEKGRRSGTLNVSGIVGLGEAIRLTEKERKKEFPRMRKLQKYFIDKVRKEIRDVSLNGAKEERSPNNINFSFWGVEGESILLLLDQEGIAVSTGSACSSEKLKASHVQLAIGNDPLKAHGSIRFSLGKETNKKQLNYTISALKMIIEKLRKTAGRTVSQYKK